MSLQIWKRNSYDVVSSYSLEQLADALREAGTPATIAAAVVGTAVLKQTGTVRHEWPGGIALVDVSEDSVAVVVARFEDQADDAERRPPAG